MAKKKIKKALMAAAPLLALAMMRGGKGSNKFLASGAAGGQRLPKMDMATARKLMTQNNAMRNSMLQNAPVTQEELMDFGNDQGFGFGLMAKKGGRIVKGKRTAVRTKGFSKTKKKQANKMRKK